MPRADSQGGRRGNHPPWGTERDTQRAAVALEQELTRGSDLLQTSWDEARTRFEDEHLRDRPKRTCESYLSALASFERHIGQPASMRLVTASMLSDLVARIRRSGASHARAASVVRHLMVFLRWCERLQIIDRAPQYTMPRAPRGERHGGKGRAITATEFARMLRAVRATVHPQPARPWRRLLRGLWLSGLRLGEALRLTWDAGPLRLDIDHEYPVIRIAAGADKRGRASLLPLTPDFVRWIGRVPVADRTGWVFALPYTRRPGPDCVTRVISSIGAAAHTGPGKHPTAHDLRRSFATRWAFRLPPLALQAILRHSSMQTTLGYYVDLSSTAADVAKLLAGQ